MKNRRIAIVAFLLISCVCLSFGFAAVADDLNITGTVGANVEDGGPVDKEFEIDVYFSNVAINATDSTAQVNTSSQVNLDNSTDESKDSITITAAGFANKDDKLVVNCTIKNDSADLKAEIAEPTRTVTGTYDGTSFPEGSNWEDYFTIETNFGTNRTVTPGGTTEFTVTITMIKAPVKAIALSFEYDFTATAEEAAATP